MKQPALNGHTVASQRPLARRSPGEEVKTDLNKWRLLDERGRQTWHYLTTDKQVEDWPQSTADKYFLELPLVRGLCLM